MSDPANRVERRYLLIAASGNLLLGCVGLAIASAASSQAILLDGLFNITYFIAGLFTIRIARLVARGDDERFPHGYGFFEPLINGVKGILVLGVSTVALVGAVQAVLAGGRPIAAGMAVAYGIFATALCWILAWISRRGARRTESPLIIADADNWIVNAVVSTGVLIAFSGNYLISGTALEFLSPYVDPVVVISIVLLFIAVPIRIAWQALMELLNRAPPPEVVSEVRRAVEAGVVELPVKELYVRVIQPGRTRWVMVHVVLPRSFAIEGLPALDRVREMTLEQLKQGHPGAVLDMLFTAETRWGAPISAGGQS